MPRPADQRHRRGTTASVISWWRLVPSYGWDGTSADPWPGLERTLGAVLACWRSLELGCWGRVEESGRVADPTGSRGLAGSSDPAKGEPDQGAMLAPLFLKRIRVPMPAWGSSPRQYWIGWNRVVKRFRLRSTRVRRHTLPSRCYASPWIDLACA